MKYNTAHPKIYTNLDDEITKDMTAQISITDSLKGKNIEELTNKDWDKILLQNKKNQSENYKNF